MAQLEFFQRRHSNGTPIRSWTVAGLHWKWSITWRWILVYAPWSELSNPRPVRWRINKNGGGQIGVGLPLIGGLDFYWQRNMPWKKK